MSIFPFEEKRDVQSKLIKDIEKCVKEKKHIVAHAPTGIGKTAAAVSSCLKFSIENNKNIFFLTSRHTQHNIVLETLESIKKRHKIKINAVDFIGKKWMCCVPEIESLGGKSFSDYCKDARLKDSCRFYNNFLKKGKITEKTERIIDELKKTMPHCVEEIIRASSKEEVCPYEISCALARESNFIIADYNHLFNPHIMRSFFSKIQKEIEDSIIIVDEAQNLPGRIRKSMSSGMSNFTLKLAEEEAENSDYPELADDIRTLNEILSEMCNQILEKQEEGYIERDYFIKLVERVSGRNYRELMGDLILAGEEIRIENKKSFLGGVGSFLSDWLNEEEGYTRILSKNQGRKKNELAIKCLDPGIISKDVFQECHSSVLMSGTLLPTRMYRDLLRMDEERTICREYPSPFPKQNQLTLVVPETTTKFTRRGETEFEKIAVWSSRMSNAVPGNVALFFPSYYLRDRVLQYFQNLNRKRIFVEQQGMMKKEKKEFIEKFKGCSNEGAVFLGVIGGSFGEGIDLPGKFLNGVVVVGIPLEKPNLETKALINYYDNLFGTGWDYGYLFPAMNKAIQACGRVIRSESDKGAVILLDERFAWRNYFRLLPKEWDIITTQEPVSRIKEFFNSF